MTRMSCVWYMLIHTTYWIKSYDFWVQTWTSFGMSDPAFWSINPHPVAQNCISTTYRSDPHFRIPIPHTLYYENGKKRNEPHLEVYTLSSMCATWSHLFLGNQVMVFWVEWWKAPTLPTGRPNMNKVVYIFKTAHLHVNSILKRRLLTIATIWIHNIHCS